MDSPCRPPHITPADWAHMPWPARRRAHAAARKRPSPPTEPAPRPAEDPAVVRQRQDQAVKAAGTRQRRPALPAGRVRVYRVEPGRWEITDGVNTARCASAPVAWRLIASIGRTA